MVKAWCGRRRGQGLVEFALVLTIFLMLVMGVVDLGRGVFTYNMLSEAAREGAREGVASSNSLSQMCMEAWQRVQAPGITAMSGCNSIADNSATSFGTLTITVHRGTSGSTSDLDSTQLTYTFTPVTPLIEGVTNSFTMTATSKMYVEQ
jgi:Flp pilus assembly protein TadG